MTDATLHKFYTNLSTSVQTMLSGMFVYYFQNFMRASIMIPEFPGVCSLQQKDIITHLKICAVYIFVIVALRPGFSLYKIVIHFCSYTGKEARLL